MMAEIVTTSLEEKRHVDSYIHECNGCDDLVTQYKQMKCKTDVTAESEMLGFFGLVMTKR